MSPEQKEEINEYKRVAEELKKQLTEARNLRRRLIFERKVAKNLR